MGSLLRGISDDRRKLLVAAALILALAGLLRFYHIGWSFSDNGIDEGIMLERSLMVGRGLPLYSGMPADQAPLAFYIGGALDGNLLDLRLVVATLSIAAIAACMLAAKKLKGGVAMLAAGLLLTVDFAFLRESRLFSLDLVSSSFVAFSIVPLMFYLKDGNRTALALSGLLLGLSISSKLLGALPLLGIIVFLVLERKSEAMKRRWIPDMMILLASASIPLVLFLAWLGPKDMIQGMVLDQGHRGADYILKLSIIGYFGLNLAYVLPLVRLGRVWRSGPECRALLSMVLVTLAFMILQPLTFFHHLVLLSPPLAILAAVVISDSAVVKEGACDLAHGPRCYKKGYARISPLVAMAIVGMVVSAGLAAYGLAMQERNVQYAYADLIRAHSDPDDYVIAGDPQMTSLAGRMTPPTAVNVAYRTYPDVTLEGLEAAIDQNVTVVVVCYRLNDIQGLREYLLSEGFVVLPEGTVDSPERPVLSLFEDGLGQITFYYRPG